MVRGALPATTVVVVELIEALRAVGHPLELVEPFSDLIDPVGAVVRHASGTIEAAADPRSEGAIAAW